MSAAKRPPPPIYSMLVHEPELEERLDAFVLALGGRIDGLQDLEADGHFVQLESESASFSSEAAELGYPPLADAAQSLRVACRERVPESVRKCLEHLTELSKRVRRGHRGAA